VLAAVAALGDVDQLDGVLVEGALVLLVAAPVGVGSLHHDLALLHQPLGDQLDLESLVLRLLDAAHDVLEIDEHRQLPVIAHPHVLPRWRSSSSPPVCAAGPWPAPAPPPLYGVGGGRPTSSGPAKAQ